MRAATAVVEPGASSQGVEGSTDLATVPPIILLYCMLEGKTTAAVHIQNIGHLQFRGIGTPGQKNIIHNLSGYRYS